MCLCIKLCCNEFGKFGANRQDEWLPFYAYSPKHSAAFSVTALHQYSLYASPCPALTRVPCPALDLPCPALALPCPALPYLALPAPRWVALLSFAWVSKHLQSSLLTSRVARLCFTPSALPCVVITALGTALHSQDVH